MHQYNFEYLFGFPNIWGVVIVAAVLTVILIVAMVLWSIATSWARVLGFSHQPNEDDPEWLEYCKRLNNTTDSSEEY